MALNEATIRRRLTAIREETDALFALLDQEEPTAAPARAEPAPPAPQAPAPVAAPMIRRAIAWGARVSETFRDRVWWIADTIEMDPDDLMSCIAWESGRTFRPDIRNQAGSGATGLIQFMPATARALGTTTAALAAMTAEDQLNYVYQYFRPWRGKLRTLGDVYMTILWPKGVGKSDSYVVFGGGVAYQQNAGLDIDKDGRVTRAECLAKLRALKSEGMRPANMA